VEALAAAIQQVLDKAEYLRSCQFPEPEICAHLSGCRPYFPGFANRGVGYLRASPVLQAGFSCESVVNR
jgi:hypothetical protein